MCKLEYGSMDVVSDKLQYFKVVTIDLESSNIECGMILPKFIIFQNLI